MTKIIRKKHSKEIKFKGAMAMVAGNKTINEISQEFGVHQSVLHRWKKDLLEKGPLILVLSQRFFTIQNLQFFGYLRLPNRKIDPKRSCRSSYQDIVVFGAYGVIQYQPMLHVLH